MFLFQALMARGLPQGQGQGKALNSTRCFTAERSPKSRGGRVMCGGQGALGRCGCLKSANSLQLSA